MAEEYADHLRTASNFRKDESPLSRLRKLEHKFRLASALIMIEIAPKHGRFPAKYNKFKGNAKPEIANYVKTIADYYDKLNNALPSTWKNTIINKIELELNGIDVEKVRIKIGKKNYSLSEWVVDAMRYEYVQEKLMQSYIRKLEVKSCVYCNAQHAVTAIVERERSKDKKGNIRIKRQEGSFYELDHNLPKSRYPYLCTNFYNLQPCCSSCNRRKNSRELGYSMYSELGDAMSLHPLHFTLESKDVVSYRIRNKCEGITAHLCNYGSDTKPKDGDGSLADRFNHLLGIEGIYQEFSSEVEELLWRHKIYSKGYISSLETQMKSLGIKYFDFRRFILGTYPDGDNATKRPLAIMAQDIWEQIEGKKI